MMSEGKTGYEIQDCDVNNRIEFIQFQSADQILEQGAAAPNRARKRTAPLGKPEAFSASLMRQCSDECDIEVLE